ncbi:putative dsRNA-binding protein [Bacillus sp. REN3]|uniref:putative dsRNA-binding protein n=1 Tax=Bacillus sp. REN3 TaxID=2802440 RepID=UPI001AED92F6|nr:putative dsRNA-binding protein [Bacillus sp. REN3]
MIVEKLKKQLKIDIDTQILQEALYHSSYLNEKKRSNEIEMQKSYIHLGKLLYHLAIVTMITEEGTKNHKEISEKLTQYKDEILVQFYDEYKFDEYLYIGKGELNFRKDRYLDHCLIVFYHIYKGNGFYRLIDILFPLYKKGKKVEKQIDYKSALQEYIQKIKMNSDSIQYETVSVDGPPHNCSYTEKVSANGLSGIGTECSKKKAQQKAAQNWFENNQLSILIKQSDKPALSVKKETSGLTSSREAELKRQYKILQLTTKDLSLKKLDICFTHKSFANEKRLNTVEIFSLYAWYGAIVIPFIIGEFILQDFQLRASGKYSRMMELTSSLVSKRHLSACLPNSIYRSVRIPNKGDLSAASLRADIIQSLVGAMFLQNLNQENEKLFNNIKSFVNTFIISSFVEDSESVDYRSYLQIITQGLNMETKAKLVTSGPAHHRRYDVKISIFFSGGEKFLEGRGKQSTKKQSINIACKDIIDQVNDIYHLNNKNLELPNNTIMNQTLGYFIRNAINNKNPIKFLDIVGGLCLKRWSLAQAVNIVTHLYKRGLMSELFMVLFKWENLYSRKNVENCIVQLPDKEREAILSKWQEIINKRERLKKTAQKEEIDIESELSYLLEEFDFKPVGEQTPIIGKIGVRESQNDECKIGIKGLNEDDGIEGFEEIDDLFNFDPS